MKIRFRKPRFQGAGPFRVSTASFQEAGDCLTAYLADLRQSIKDPAVPLPVLHVRLNFIDHQYNAWTAAQRGGGLILMPSDEQSANDRMYVGLHTLDQIEDKAFVSTGMPRRSF